MKILKLKSLYTAVYATKRTLPLLPLPKQQEWLKQLNHNLNLNVNLDI